MIILKANKDDLNQVMDILEETRLYFKESGIPQWQGDYPSYIDFEEDVDLSRLFVIKEEDLVLGMFVIADYDHNYDYIEGAWLNNEEYVAIHRMAIRKEYKRKGIANFVFKYIKDNYKHVRIDTHELNVPMKALITSNNFKFCGIVYMEDHTKRNAYEYIKGAVTK